MFLLALTLGWSIPILTARSTPRLIETGNSSNEGSNDYVDATPKASDWVFPLSVPAPISQGKTSGLVSWPIPSKEDAKALITFWANYYGIDVQRALRITYCESGWNSAAKNTTSSASGLYQFLSSTFNSTAIASGHPEWTYRTHVLNAEVNAQLGAWLAKNGGWQHWVCR